MIVTDADITNELALPEWTPGRTVTRISETDIGGGSTECVYDLDGVTTKVSGPNATLRTYVIRALRDIGYTVGTYSADPESLPV